MLFIFIKVDIRVPSKHFDRPIGRSRCTQKLLDVHRNCWMDKGLITTDNSKGRRSATVGRCDGPKLASRPANRAVKMLRWNPDVNLNKYK